MADDLLSSALSDPAIIDPSAQGRPVDEKDTRVHREGLEHVLSRIIDAIRDLQTRTASVEEGGISFEDAALINPSFINPFVVQNTLNVSSGSVTGDASKYGVWRLTVQGNITIASPIGMVDGGTFTIALVESGGADRTITLSGFYATDSSFTLTSGTRAVITFIRIDGAIYASYVPDMSLA